MADLQPFRGVRYSRSAGDPALLTAPPYDVISPAEREQLERTDPCNVVRLILPNEERQDPSSDEKYRRAAATLEAWLEDGTLARDERPALYVYEQRYIVAGDDRVQRGVVASVALDETSILPHERTMAAPVADRLALMRATRANLEPIVCIYAGEEGAGRSAVASALKATPSTSFRSPDGVAHALYPLDDGDAVEAVVSALKPTRLVIADGHHRHRTAQAYRDERRAADGAGPWDRMMILVVDAAWSGPSVLPIHRTVAGVDAGAALGRTFDVEEAVTRDATRLERELADRRQAQRTFAVMDRRSAWWLTLADKEAAEDAMPQERSPEWRDLDVAVLHALAFDRLLGVRPGYVHSVREAEDALASGDASLAFLLAPTPLEAVRRIAERGEAMPPKSTYFVPKPRSGVVIRLLDRG